MDKSYVTMEQRVCVVCGKTFDTGSILMDTRLSNRFDMNTVTGNGMCPEHKKLADEGYVALVEVDESKSTINSSGRINPEDAYRTGRMAHIKEEAARRVFNVPVKGVAFVQQGVIDKLGAMTKK